MKFIFYPDAPPMQNGGHANHSIAWSWSQAMQEYTPLVITHRYRRGISIESIRKTIGIPILFCPDFSFFGLRRISELLRSSLDGLLFIACLPWLVVAIQRTGAKRIFAFPSGMCLCLVNEWLLCWATGLPVEVYLVDDLEAQATMNRQFFLARVTRWVESMLLPRFAKVYTLSKGHAEHLRAKYAIQPEWLPLVIRTEKIFYAPPPAPGDTRYIGFCGSTSELYREPLIELSHAVARLNRTTSYRYRIALITIHRPSNFAEVFPDPSIVDIFEGLPNDEIVARLRLNYANFLPYSFDDDVKVMVSTAFSCKTSEYFAAGRPIMVYGPVYSSVARHFLENNLPLVETTRGELERLIANVDAVDSPELIARYREVIQKYHSPEALRHQLLAFERQPTQGPSAPTRVR